MNEENVLQDKGLHLGVYSYSVGIDFRRQNLSSKRQILTTKVDPRAVRVKHKCVLCANISSLTARGSTLVVRI